MYQMFRISGAEIQRETIQLNTLVPGVESGIVCEGPDGAIKVRQSRIEPNGVIPSHRSRGVAFFQVVSGSGTVYMEDDDGNVLSEAKIEAGDYMVYQDPHLMHRYVANEDGLVYTVINLKI